MSTILVQPQAALIDAAVSSRAAIVDYTAARAVGLDRLPVLGLGGAGELTPARAAALDRLINDVTAARGAALDALLAGGAVRGGTAQVSIDYPSLAGVVPLTAGAGGWTLGAWVQLVAAGVVAQSVLVGVIASLNGGVSEEDRIEIGVGAAAAEVVIARVRKGMFLTSAAGITPYVFLPTEPAQIPANSRIAARSASSVVSGTTNVAILTCPVPF